MTNLAFDQTGAYLVSIGGGTTLGNWVVALWKIEDLLKREGPQTNNIRPTPICSTLVQDVTQVNALSVHLSEDGGSLSVALGTNNGLKFFSKKTVADGFSEVKASSSHTTPNLKNVYGVEIRGDEIFAVGDHEYVFVYRKANFEIERMVKTTSNKIYCIGHMKITDEGSEVMYTIGDNMRIQIWSDEILIDEP